jgi:hypothetical protein
MGYMECIQKFVGKLHEKPNRKQRKRCEYNIKLNIKDVVRMAVILR